MSKFGIWQLNKVKIEYSDSGGSSRGMKEYITKHLNNFARQNPQITFEVRMKRNKHPSITGVYLNGNNHKHGVKNVTTSTIIEKMNMLRNQWGNKPKKIGFSKSTTTPTIQGYWSPLLFKKFKNFGVSISPNLTNNKEIQPDQFEKILTENTTENNFLQKQIMEDRLDIDSKYSRDPNQSNYKLLWPEEDLQRLKAKRAFSKKLSLSINPRLPVQTVWTPTTYETENIITTLELDQMYKEEEFKKQLNEQKLEIEQQLKEQQNNNNKSKKSLKNKKSSIDNNATEELRKDDASGPDTAH